MMRLAERMKGAFSLLLIITGVFCWLSIASVLVDYLTGFSLVDYLLSFTLAKIIAITWAVAWGLLMTTLSLVMFAIILLLAAIFLHAGIVAVWSRIRRKSASTARCKVTHMFTREVLYAAKDWKSAVEGAVKAGINLEHAALTGVNLTGADLRGGCFANAYMENINLTGANLMHADLREARLPYANFTGANLRGASLRGASFFQTNFAGANLEDADLTYTFVNENDLLKKGLTANLAGANLKGTKFGPTPISR